MRLLRLQISDFRNLRHLNLSLGPGATLFVGDNAQGKTNLLEAIYLLATMRGRRVATEAELIRRQALQEPLPLARVVGEAETRNGPLKIEVAVVARPNQTGTTASKVVWVNGVPRRLAEAVGQITAVMFAAEDLDLISGPPSLRRRYIDITLSQADRAYLAARQRFERVLFQRNHLLRRIREGLAHPDELAFWDGELAREGGIILHARAVALRELGQLARQAHAELAPSEDLLLAYQPRLDAAPDLLAMWSPQETATAYAEALRRGLSRDVAAGMTLQGPHRDDIALALEGIPASGYASRAQQRTIALSLRLAEARFLLARRGDPPILLLDDVLSEMDSARRRSVTEALADYDQFLITGTDLDRFPPGFLSRAAVYSVAAGAVAPLAPDESPVRQRKEGI